MTAVPEVQGSRRGFPSTRKDLKGCEFSGDPAALALRADDSLNAKGGKVMSMDMVESNARLALEMLLALPSGYLAILCIVAGTLAAWGAAGPRDSGMAARLLAYLMILALVLVMGLALAHIDGDIDIVEILTRRSEPDVPALR